MAFGRAGTPASPLRQGDPDRWGNHQADFVLPQVLPDISSPPTLAPSFLLTRGSLGLQGSRRLNFSPCVESPGHGLSGAPPGGPRSAPRGSQPLSLLPLQPPLHPPTRSSLGLKQSHGLNFGPSRSRCREPWARTIGTTRRASSCPQRLGLVYGLWLMFGF